MYSMEIRQEEERFQLPQFEFELEEETKPTSKTRQICSNGCGRPANVCLCNVLPAQPILTSTQIIILHHPHERRHKLATVPILTKCLNNCQIKVGRRLRSGSFPLLDSLYNASLQNPLLPHQAIFLFPGTDSSPSIELNQWASSSSHSSKPEITNLVLIVFDGTWKHAKEMVSASLPFLSKFADQVCLSYDAGVDGESIYNSDLVLRKEPFSGCMSSIEAVARSLGVLESNGDEIEKVLISVLRAMVQFQACNLKPLKPRPKLSKKGKEAKEKSPKCQSHGDDFYWEDALLKEQLRKARSQPLPSDDEDDAKPILPKKNNQPVPFATQFLTNTRDVQFELGCLFAMLCCLLVLMVAGLVIVVVKL